MASKLNEWWRRVWRAPNVTPAPIQSEAAVAAEPRAGYASDRPIETSDEDRFGRWPFASRIAETLATRTDPSSVVIGLYGPWGDGKTSTLHLMEEALKSYPNAVPVRFNPWYFGTQERLLRGFFQTLAEALGKKLSNQKEQVGELLKKYGGLLSIASLTFGGALEINPGEAAKGLGEGLSTVELETLRTRLEGILRSAGVRVVVMIDDIDRLDRDEIHAIFKLVKLSAGFEQTSYVLAFDDEIVSESLGSRYGAGNALAGRNFLEKIVQVPLHLPAADEVELRALTFSGIEAALKDAGIELSEAQGQAFGRRFVDGLEFKLRTPRQSKLYVNAVTFALPLLKGEVNTVDQLLLEGVRVFYPRLYAVIRDNPSRFLAQPSDGAGENELRQEIDRLVDHALAELTQGEIRSVKSRLIEPLFPRYGRMGYGPEWEKEWARKKHLCSEAYFARYFAYSVPPGDVSDAEAAAFIELASKGTPEEIAKTLEAVNARRGSTKLIRKLREVEAEVDPAVAGNVALAIIRNGQHLPRERQSLLSDWTFTQAGILASRMVGRIPEGPHRDALAKLILREAQPLALAFECLRWMRKSDDDEKPRLLAEEVELELGAILAARIKAASADGPLYRTYGTDTPALLWAWHKFGLPSDARDHLRPYIENDPSAANEFLNVFVGLAWGMESGLSSPADFGRSNYNSVVKFVDPELILRQLRKRYGAELDDPQYYHSEGTPLDEVVAHQFAKVHRDASDSADDASED